MKYIKLLKLNESNFSFFDLDENDKEKIFNIFTNSYTKSVGKSWERNKFYSKADNWLFFGDKEGFIAIRQQNSGYYKLVGVGGNPKSILNGLNEIEEKSLPIWGMVSLDIQKMLHKKGFKTPPTFLLKILYKIIPSSVFGSTNYDINSDGSLTLKYSDVGDSKKYFVGNDEYFKKLKVNLLPQINKLPSIIKNKINDF